MKVIALKSFEGIRDKERNVYPKEGDTWETSEERAEFLQSKGVVEIIKEEKTIEEVAEKIYSKKLEEEHKAILEDMKAIEKESKPKKKKSSKK